MKGLLVCIALLVAASCRLPKYNGISAIKFQADTIFFKQIKIGDSITKTFRFANTGDKDVKVINVGSACSCTIGKYDSLQIVNPDETGEINVTYKNDSDTGNIIRVIVVETNTQQKLHPLYIITR